MADLHVFLLSAYPLSADAKERFKAASATLKTLRRRRRRVVRSADAGGLTSWLADAFFQHSLYRIVTLADGAVGEWNARRPTNAVILVRSVLETVASWNYVGGKIARLVREENIRDIHQILMRMRFGLRHKLTDDDLRFPTSTNVLTFVESLGKVDTLIDNLEAFAPTKDGRKIFRYYYDEMSEFVHPNEAGIGVFGSDIDPAAMEVNLSDSHPRTEQFVIGKVLHVTVLLDFAEKFLSLYEAQIRPAILALEAKFGPRPENWPPPTQGA